MISMPASLRLAFSSLNGRRLHTALIVAAVALAASLFAAVSVLIGTVTGNVEFQLNRMLGATQARIIHRFSGRFSDEQLATVRTWPEVKHATGLVFAPMTLVHTDQRKDAETGKLLRVTASAVGMDPEMDSIFSTMELREGRRPMGPNEALIDPMTASIMQAKVGDRLEVQRFGDPIELEVVGIFERRLIGTLQRPQIRVDYRTVSQAIDKDNELSQVSIILNDDQDVDAFLERRSADITEPLTIERGEMVRAGFDRRVRAANLLFMLATMIGLLSCSFIVVTGMTTAVVERQRELAVLRCIGASRKHLVVSQLLVGVIIGVLGGCVGIPLGMLIATPLLQQYSEALPAGVLIDVLGLAWVFLGCLGAGLVGAAYPAWLASHVPPLRAMTMRGRTASPRGIVACTVIGLALIAVQLALLLIADPSTRFWAYITAGLPLLLIGYFLLSVPALLVLTPMVTPIVSALLRLPRGMLAGSMRATPFRNGLTAGALMIGMALLISSWSEGRALLNQWVSKMKFADCFAINPNGMTRAQQNAILELPFVVDHCPIGYVPLRIVGEQFLGLRGVDAPSVTCISFDSDSFFRMNNVEWLQGDPQHAIELLQSGTGILVADQFLARGAELGDQLVLGSGKAQHTFEIVGVVSSAGLEVAVSMFGLRNAYMEHGVSSVFIEFDAVSRLYDNRDAHILQLDLDESVTDEDAEAAVIDAAPGVLFRSGRSIRDMLNEIAITAFTITTAAAAIELLIACFGVGNIIMANIHARRFEYGVLRAVGGGRGLLLRLILAEAAMLGFTGVVVGATMGMHFALVSTVHYRDIAGIDLNTGFPIGPAAIGLFVVIALALLAALPAAVILMLRKPTWLLATGRAA